MALGLGEMTLGSYLNEPLRAQVDLLDVGGMHEDQIKIRLATAEDFKRMGVDRAYFLTSLSFHVEIDDSGRGRIVVTSEEPVLEPYLDFIVEARWPSGRLLREYTVLVDPPVFDQSTRVVSASTRVAEISGEPEPAKKKREVVATTGTRVDVRNSQLGPGEMPTRAYNADTSPAPVAGTRYMIHRDDTLWQIASRARPGNASVHQTMLDIQRLNPEAFIGGNINRIKSGYIIYLPNEGDIKSGSQPQALAEVRKQNEDWRQGRTSSSPGPSLRISAEPQDAPAATAAVAPAVPAASGAGAAETADKAGLEVGELQQRLASMEQQVATLQRIVDLKDNQIAALQNAAAGTGTAGAAAVAEGAAPGATEAEPSAVEGELSAVGAEPSAVAAGPSAVEGEAGGVEGQPVAEVPAAAMSEVPAEGAAPAPAEGAAQVPVAAAATEPAAVAQESAPVEPAVVTTPAAPAEESSGFFSNLWYVLVAIAVAVLGMLYLRRRGQGTDTAEAEPLAPRDVFADVKLKEQALEVEDAAEPPEQEAAPTREQRGYGKAKHDEYVSDDANDALAEAEIYIAYGRFPQAIDLLKNALVNDPDNAAYRLKLLQLYMETGNRSAAMQQFAELESIGDGESIAAARYALEGSAAPTAREGFATEGSQRDPELLADFGDSLESDFSGLEIEDSVADGYEDELDLSADFEDAELAPGRADEDLVFAAESSGLSTKLDLARAYIDMGDEDGARQILEEVAAEGNEELQAEARALLQRIG
ncbi:MAG: FimV family protein [Halioglobus sp.]|nr:FimV family protein [Halioglobus sp.]